MERTASRAASHARPIVAGRHRCLRAVSVAVAETSSQTSVAQNCVTPAPALQSPTKLPPSHLESSKRALELLKEQEVNREFLSLQLDLRCSSAV